MRHAKITLPNRLPRSILAVRAEGPNTKDMVGQLAQAFNDFKANYDGRLNDVEREFSTKIAAMYMNGPLPVSGSYRPDDPEYTTAFAAYFRAGGSEAELRAANMQGDRARIRAAMSVGSNSDGGYLAPTEWDRRILEAQRVRSPMRRLATVQTTTVNAYSTLWNEKGWGSGWVGETAARPATTNATLSPLTFGHGEIYAMPSATQRLLDDADINVEQWLADELADEFDRQEGIAFLSGDGVNKPFGLLQYVTGGAGETQHPGGTLTVVDAAAAGAVTGDELIDFTYGLPAPYRQNASWLMNSQTAATIAKLKDGQGNYLWRESFQTGAPPTLLGRPVEFDEAMPSMAAGNTAIAYGDFKAGYLINDRIGTRILRDPYTNKPFVNFYATKRVGGGVKDPNAIRLLKMAAA